MKDAPIHDVQHLSEKQWFSMVMKNRKEAEKAGNLMAVARCDELLARRMNLLPETPQRQAELDAAKKKEIRIICLMRHHPQVLELINRLLAEGETYPDVYSKAENRPQEDPMPPQASGKKQSPSIDRASSQFGIPENFSGNSEVNDGHSNNTNL